MSSTCHRTYWWFVRPRSKCSIILFCVHRFFLSARSIVDPYLSMYNSAERIFRKSIVKHYQTVHVYAIFMFFWNPPDNCQIFFRYSYYFSVSGIIIDKYALRMIFFFCAYVVSHFSYIWGRRRRFNSVPENHFYVEFEAPCVVVTFHFHLFFVYIMTYFFSLLI